MNEGVEYTLDLVSFTRCCRLDADTVSGLVDAGVLEPIGAARSDWRFPPRAVARGQVAARLMRDLELDTASVALVLDLLEERDRLRGKLALLRALVDDR